MIRPRNPVPLLGLTSLRSVTQCNAGVEPIAIITAKKTNKEVKKRQIVIRDHTNKEVGRYFVYLELSVGCGHGMALIHG